jgi:hypothetical protein
MATLSNFDEEFAAGANPIQPSDMLPIHEASSSVKKSLLGWQMSAAAFVAAGATLALVTATHGGKTVKLDTAAGSVVTLPAASGSGVKFRFVITTIATSNSHIVKVANASDTMVGIVFGMSDDPATMKGWLASGTSDTITLNRSTTGSVALGEILELTDIAANLWLVTGVIAQTGTEATPFSATV